MTTQEMFDGMRKELKETRELYRQGVDALHEEIKNMTEPAPAGGKLYTAFDVIRMVQAAVSDEICGLSAGEMAIAYEVERAVLEKLAKEENA